MKVTGSVTAPDDMVEAARKSLSPEGFDQIMRQTKGRPPTPKELCAAVEMEQHNDHRTERSAS